LGDQKTVHTKSVSRIFIKDSLVNNTEATGNCSIKVIDTVKNYTLLYANEPDALDIETKSSNANVHSVVNVFKSTIKKIEEETKTFKYELLVDKNTGLAIKVKNGDEYLKMVEQVASTMMAELGEKMSKTNAQIDSMKQKVIAYSKMAEPKILETAINQFNYMMQPYSYTFPINSTVSEKALIHDVNAMGEFGDIRIPGVLTISSRRNNNSLTIHTYTDYDKDFLLEQIKKKHKDMSDLTTSDIFLSEKVETVFAITKGWIVSHKSDVVFKMKEVKVMNETTVSFQ
jgi:predicted small secreted protein